MSAIALADGERLHWPGGVRLGDRTIAVLVFLSGFVFIEPSPSDLLLVATAIVWAFCGLRLNRYSLPHTVLLLCYIAGGWLAFTQVRDFTRPFSYMMTSTFLVASSIFFAAVVAEAPERRLRLIRNAYVAVGVVTAIIAVLAYFGVLPHSEFFKRYDRAMGPFKDPNVFAPFLVLPLCFLVRDILTRRLRESVWEIAGSLIIIFAIFLAFSRAAWGLSVIAVLVTAYLAFASSINKLVRFRLVAYLLAGSAAIMLLLAVAVSIPAIRDLYEIRAHVVQDYDDGHGGRFDRQWNGFFLVQEKPLGLGPWEFAKIFGDDQHNMWLKGFTDYGWLGGFSYIILVVWTLAESCRLLFRQRPWTPIVQCSFAVYFGHVFLMHNVIDNDHWRHLYLIYGILWGAIAAEKLMRRKQRQTAAVSPSPVKRRSMVAAA